MSLTPSSPIEQIAKMLLSQKDLILNIAKHQNDDTITQLAQQYQEIFDQTNLSDQSLYQKSDAEEINELKTQVQELKEEVQNLQSQLSAVPENVQSETLNTNDQFETVLPNAKHSKSNLETIQHDLSCLKYEMKKLKQENQTQISDDISDLKLIKPLQEEVAALSQKVQNMNLNMNENKQTIPSPTEASSFMSTSQIDNESVNSLQSQITFCTKSLDTSIQRCLKTIDEQQEEIVKLRNRFETQTETHEEFQTMINTINEQLQLHDNRISEIEHHDLTATEDSVRCIKYSLKKHIVNTNNSFEEANGRFDLLKDMMLERVNEIEAINNTLQSHQEELNDCARKIDISRIDEALGSHSTDLEKHHNILIDHTEQLSKLEEGMKAKTEELTRLQETFADMQDSLRNLNDEVDSMRLVFKEAKELTKAVDTVKEELNQHIKENDARVNDRSVSMPDSKSSESDVYRSLRDELSFLEANFIETANLHTVSIEDHQQQLTSIKETIETQREEQSLQNMQNYARLSQAPQVTTRDVVLDEDDGYHQAEIDAKVRDFEQSIDELKKDVSELTELNKMKFEVEAIKSKMESFNQVHNIFQRLIALSDENQSDKRIIRCLKHEISSLKKKIANVISDNKEAQENLFRQLNELQQQNTPQIAERGIEIDVNNNVDERLSEIEKVQRNNSETLNQISLQLTQQEVFNNTLNEKLKLSDSRFNETEKTTNNLSSNLQDLLSSLNNVESQINDMKETQLTTEEQIKTVEDKNTQLSQQIEDIRSNCDLLNKKFNENDQQYLQIYEKFNSVDIAVGEGFYSLRCVKHEMKKMLSTLANLTSQINNDTTELKNLAQIVQRTTQIEAQIAAVVQEHEKTSKSLSDVNQFATDSETRFTSIDNKLQEIDSLINSFNETHESLRNEIESVKSEISKYAEQPNTLDNTSNQQIEEEIASLLSRVNTLETNIQSRQVEVNDESNTQQNNNESELAEQIKSMNEMITKNANDIKEHLLESSSQAKQNSDLVQSINDQINDLKQSSIEYHTQISQLQQSIDNINSQITNNEQENKDFHSEISQKVDSLTDLQRSDSNEIKKLTQFYEDLENKFVEFVTSQKKPEEEESALQVKEREINLNAEPGEINENEMIELQSALSTAASGVVTLGYIMGRVETNHGPGSLQNQTDLSNSLQTLEGEIRRLRESTMSPAQERDVSIESEDLMSGSPRSQPVNQQINEELMITIKCLKHEVKKLKQQSSLQSQEIESLKEKLSEIESLKEKQSEIESNTQKLIEDENQKVMQELENLRNENSERQESFNKTISELHDQIDTEIKDELEKATQKQETDLNKLTKTIARLKKELTQQFDTLKTDVNSQLERFNTTATSLQCVKHELRKIKILFEDNAEIASRVDQLTGKMKKLKTEVRSDEQNQSTKTNSEDVQQVRDQLSSLHQTFVDTSNLQSKSIEEQRTQLQNMRRNFDAFQRKIKERLREVETTLGLDQPSANSSFSRTSPSTRTNRTTRNDDQE